ncbi:hypothetical protein CPB86DRAFT_844315 [Serendipita vermifera]|nr:hypothetical protein CPB86DRAFT_844315 [Serendipita vermifera]
MPPQTRKSHAKTDSDQTGAPALHISLPDDLPTTLLDSLTGGAAVDWSAPTPETILSVYRLIVSQKEEFDNALRDWEERLAQKDADIEQALQDHETFRVEYNEQIEVLRAEVGSLKRDNEELTNGRTALQAQLATVTSTSSLSNQESNQLKYQLEEREREKKTLTDALDAALTRETRLHGENNELRTEAQNIRKQVSELQTKLAETSSTEATLQFKVSTLEQQINLLQEGNDSLNTELSQQLNRYAELRRSRTDEVSSLQSKLDQKTAEYDREVERARLLHNSNQDMERKLTDALARNRDLQSNEAANTRAFQEEMQVCKDLLAQYEKIADEAKARVAEIEKEEEHIRRELSRREESLLAQTERERERAEAVERKVEELEEVLQRVQTGELSMAETSFATHGRMSMSPGPAGVSSLMLSPTASIVSKLQRGGRSITEVYADYVRLQKELQQEKQEKARLETTLNDIFNEIQDRAPILTQQRLEYDRISAEARELASQLSEVMENRDQQARAAREANHALMSKQKEIDLLNKQQVDLSRQVRGLMHQLARTIDPTLPEEFVDDPPPSTNGIVDADAFVSSNLVLFRSLPHLQQQNQTLLKLTRSLAAQLEEKDRKAAAEEESEMMIEARNLIESLQAQLKTSNAKLEAYIKERDVFKAMAARRQAGGSIEPVAAMAVDGGEDYHQKYDEEHAALETLRRESEKAFEALRAELKQAKAESTELHVSLGKARATVEYHVERYKLLQSNTAAQAEELKALATRNNQLEVSVRQAESRIGELSASLAAYSGNLTKAQNETQLLRSEKALQKSREERLEQENRQLHAERARNNQTLEDYRRMKDELALVWEESRQNLEKEKGRLTSDLTNLREELMSDRASSRSRLMEKEVELRDLNHRMNQLNEDLTKSREAAAVAQANQSHLQARSDDLSRQLQLAMEKLAVYERRPGTVGVISAVTGETEVETLRAQVAELSAELKSVQLELTNEKANGLMYQELAQTTEQALEELRKSTDEFSSKTQQDLVLKDDTIQSEIISLQERVNALQIEKQTFMEQKAALEADIESKTAQFTQEKKLLEDIVAEVRGADERALREQQTIHQELLAEAQKTREAQQKYQNMLVDHASVLKDRDTLQQQLREAQIAANKHLEDTKAAQAVLANSQKSWEQQAELLNEELVDLRKRYDSVAKQNDILHKQLASVTSEAARLGELSESTLAAIQEPSNDAQVQELQQVIQHVRRESDLLRGQHELLKRENARISGDVRRLTAELESTRQRLTEERELASKASLAPSDQQALLAKISENAALIESNRVLRVEKQTLEERLAKKSDELIAAESEISPLKQEVITLRSERDYIKIENETLQNSIDQWRKRATSIMTKTDRIDPEVHEQLKSEKERLEAEITTIKSQLARANDQVVKWKDAQQQWKNAVQTVTEQSKERQSQLAAERDAANIQNEATTKELESAKADVMRLTRQNQELAASAAGGPAVDANATAALNAEISQLKEEKHNLLAENTSLKEKLASAQSSAAPAIVAPGELERSAQALKEAQQKANDMQMRARGMAGELKNSREKIANLEKALAAKDESSAAPEVESIVAQRVEAAMSHAKAEQDSAVAAAVAPLQAQIETLSQSQPDLLQLQQRHAAEIQALQNQLAASRASAPGPMVDEQLVEQKVNERLAVIQAEHAAALTLATENGRKEAEMKLKMLNAQFNRVKNELAQLKGGAAAQVKPTPTQANPSAVTSTVPQVTPTPNTTENKPGGLPAPVIAANAGTPASPTAARGRGRGAANPTRGAVARGRGAIPAGVGRGSVLDAVNQTISGGASTPTTPESGLSILGAGQKRAREEEESADPNALVKRLKPGEAGLPAKPVGRGAGGVTINRNRLPGTPGPQ